ncbi:ABC transporter ATP-binding protein [Aestuariivirga sp.]|uniref:ABC transporter ATP-binding protein n=1 Tax=Aestuariivirga sp. TaxID=2650926 RepID=UPI0039E3BDD4
MKLLADKAGWSVKGKSIVLGVTLAVESGETFGIVGPNGSGKSTLLRLLAGLLPHPQGTVELDGTPLASLPRRDIARRIALVEQQAEPAEALTVRDAVELGRTPWLSAFSVSSHADAEAVDEALRLVGMTAMAERNWATLSAGERQRVHIARALAQSPSLLLLDEPTNHLDIHHQLALMRLISRLPITVVMAIHDLNQAMGCDRLGVMADGRLAACGRPDDVLTPERLETVFQVGVRKIVDPLDGGALLRFRSLEDERQNEFDPHSQVPS